MRREKGSILIASLWMISIFAVFVSNLGFQSTQRAFLLKREINNLEAQTAFLSALHLLAWDLASDPEPHEDSAEDAWYGEVDLEDPWKTSLSLSVEDEESKINLNTASAALLKVFLKRLDEEKGPLKGNADDFVKQILTLRGKGKIGSFEELFLFEDIEKEDAEKVRPYVSVFTDFPGININTASPLILKSFIDSVPGDHFAKEELFRKIMERREQKDPKEGSGIFRSQELTPNLFLSKLHLNPDVQMVQLANQLVSYFTTDSKTYRLVMEHKRSGKQAFCTIRDKPGLHAMEILSWHES